MLDFLEKLADILVFGLAVCCLLHLFGPWAVLSGLVLGFMLCLADA